MTQQINAALARKLTAGHGGAGTSRTLVRALRLALARAAEEGLNLPMSVIGAKQATRAPNDLNAVVDDNWLHLVFASEQGAAAVCLDPGCVSAIMQQQTIGDVMPDPPSPRLLTDTDAAMTIPLIEGLFQRAETLLEAPEDHTSLTGMEFASRMVDLRSLALALIDETYQAVELTVELAGGARQGQICILLPEPHVANDGEADKITDHGPCLKQAAGVIRAELQAVICRVSPLLSELSGLRVGDVMPLAGARLDRTEITTIDGARVAVGRLGQCGGLRAVRINEQLARPALADEARQVFLESATGTSLTEANGEMIASEDEDAAQLLPVDPVTMIEERAPIGNSDQMVAEISQLAGLDSDQNPTR